VGEHEHTTRTRSRRCQPILKPIPKSFHLASCITELQSATMVGDKTVFLNVFALLIPSKESVTSENVDVCLAPLIEELQQLWEGIDAVDASAESVNRNFTLKVILMWCIHDFPAYGLVSGQVTKGYRGCTECGPSLTTRCSTTLAKNVYFRHRRFLNRTHPYRRLQRAFDGSQETCPPPR
jgi:hypothetical protein